MQLINNDHWYPVSNMRFFASLRMTACYNDIHLGWVGWRRSRQPTHPSNEKHCHSERNEVERRI